MQMQQDPAFARDNGAEQSRKLAKTGRGEGRDARAGCFFQVSLWPYLQKSTYAGHLEGLIQPHDTDLKLTNQLVTS